MDEAIEPRVVRHGVVDSTSERAFADLAAGRARHGDVHVADAQTKGRGRLGRAWHSAPGEGLYASFVLMPERPWNAAALTIALGLAALDAVRALGLARATLKWPNDVVLDGAKLCGVLAETRDLDPRRPAYVAGVGINVAQRAFPPELVAERPVTSLAAQGVACSVEDALRELARALSARCASIEHDVGRLETDYLRAALLDRGGVRLDVAAGSVVGELVAFSVANGVTVRSDTGVVSRHALEHVRALSAA